jgi:hypothetical protein
MTQDEILEALHKVIQENKHYTTWTVSTPHLVALVKLAIEHEREACAKLLEDTADGAKKVDPKGFVWQAIQKSAEFIRARGQA